MAKVKPCYTFVIDVLKCEPRLV